MKERISLHSYISLPGWIGLRRDDTGPGQQTQTYSLRYCPSWIRSASRIRLDGWIRLLGMIRFPVRAALVLLAALGCGGNANAQDWLQWGGPGRNFISDSKGLADSWPANGPRRLWTRTLGEGHSTVLVEKGKLYTMYRKGDQEVIVALEADSGKTIWEYAYDAPTRGMDYSEGFGPHSTPLISGDVLYAVGALGSFHALDKRTGKVLWSHELWKQMGGRKLDRGYACSPIEFKNTVILQVGGPGQAVVAFNKNDGGIAWKKQDYTVSFSSPIIIEVEGQPQLIVFAADRIVGLDPNNGDLLWTYPHQTEYGLNISTPVWGEGNLLFCSSAYNGGSRVVRLTRKDGKTTAEQVWFNNKVRVHIGTIIRIGDYAYCSSGDFGPSFFTAVNVKTGEVAWRERSFARASSLYADGKLVLLDEDGTLMLATVSPESMKVIAKTQILQHLAWTVPTLSGTRLYVRDRKTIMALDLGRTSPG
jgi:outer membrane protein assembly factor BamB